MKTLADAVLAAEKSKKKDNIFPALTGLGDLDKKLVHEAFNPYRVFGVRKFLFPNQYASVDEHGYVSFFQLLDYLHDRVLTGNAARLAVTGTLARYTERTAKILARVLNKDLKCGAGRDTFEKIYTDLNIPVFDLMLAQKIEENKGKGKKNSLTEALLRGKYGFNFVEGILAESKYDGNRLLAIVNNGAVEYLSREGRPSKLGEGGIFNDELVEMEKAVGEPIVVDGEVLASSFQQTMNAKGSANTEAKAALKFYAFDFMTLREWKARNCQAGQSTRSYQLEVLISSLKLKKIIKSKFKMCYSIDELWNFFYEVIEDGHDADGNLNGLGEGLILKKPNSKYEWDRSENWMKWKPIIDLDMKIVGYQYGNGRLAKTVANVLLEGTDENGTFIVARCGSGFKDKMRDFLEANREEMLGAVVMIECQEISLAQNAKTHSARFPVFKKIRTDKCVLPPKLLNELAKALEK